MRTIAKRLARRLLPAPIYFWLKKRHYLNDLRNLDLAEEPDLAIVRHIVCEGDGAVDIGANYGLYTTVLSHLVGEKGRVLSFEPIKPTFEILSYCVSKLRLINVVLHHMAISNNSGRMKMEIPTYDDGTENYYEARLVTDEAESGRGEIMEVQTGTLDSITSALEGDITFIKCDVEGHELAAILGAGATIRMSHPAWLIEIEGNPDDHGSAAHELFGLLSLEGYQTYWYDHKKLRLRQPGDESINYFFLTDQHCQRLQALGLV